MYHNQLKSKKPYFKESKYGPIARPKAPSNVDSEYTLFGSKTADFLHSAVHASFKHKINVQSELLFNSEIIKTPIISTKENPITRPRKLSEAISAFFIEALDEKEFKQAVKSFMTSTLATDVKNLQRSFLQIVREKNKAEDSGFEERRLKMLNLFFKEIGSFDSILLVELLLRKDTLGLTPLYYAVRRSDPALFRFYFEQVLYALKQEWISLEDYYSLLIEPDIIGATPLLQLLRSGNADNIEFFLRTIVNELKSLYVYHHLLHQADNNGVTPLHEVLQAKNTQPMYLYLSELINGLMYNKISAGDYSKLLIRQDNFGTTPLHYALKSANSVNMEVYCSELKFVSDNRCIYINQYVRQLTKKTPADVSPFVHALSSGNYANAFFYFQTLIYVHKMGLLDDKEYGKALTTSSSMNLTPLHYLVQNELIAMMHILIPELNKALSPKGYKTAVNVRCDGERLVCSSTTEQAKKINTLLAVTQKDAAKAVTLFFQQQEKKLSVMSKPVVRQSVRW